MLRLLLTICCCIPLLSETALAQYNADAYAGRMGPPGNFGNSRMNPQATPQTYRPQPNFSNNYQPQMPSPSYGNLPGNDGRPSAFNSSATAPPTTLFDQALLYPERETYLQSLRAPNILGHYLPSGTLVTGFDGATTTSILPLAAGMGRLNVADNNKAITQNRVFFDYRNFRNALVGDGSNYNFDEENRIGSIDSYTFGVEKTFGEEELFSLEFVLPVAGTMSFDTVNFGVDGGSAGNASVIAKEILSMDDHHSIVGGVAFSFPTGSDASGQLNGFNYTVHNKSNYLSPYFAVLLQPRGIRRRPGTSGGSCIPRFMGRSSFQLFGQANIPLNSHSVEAAGANVGGFKEQSLMMIDTSYAFNFCNKPENRFLTAMDGIAELHYAQTIGGGNPLSFNDGALNNITLSAASPSTMLNFTSGLSVEVHNNTQLRVGASVPLLVEKRTFDAEVIFSLNHFF